MSPKLSRTIASDRTKSERSTTGKSKGHIKASEVAEFLTQDFAPRAFKRPIRQIAFVALTGRASESSLAERARRSIERARIERTT